MSMLDPQKISMGRVRQAYALTANEVENVIQALWPDAVFPVELWRRTHETYWRAFADANQATYKIESPALPDVDTTKKFFHTYLCSVDVMAFFRKISLNIKANILKEGLKYILEEAYEDIDSVFPEEREFLFSTLSRLETVDIFDQFSPDSELFEEKILSLPASSYHFISYIFSNTVLVDKVAVIRHLRNYPFKEVKNITRAFVDATLNSFPEETPGMVISISQPQTQDTAPPSTGSRKDVERINATRHVCEELVKELLQERQAFENDRKNWKHNLLYDNGKTLSGAFFDAAERRLGMKPHGETAREVWRKVPGYLKHKGRMREQ